MDETSGNRQLENLGDRAWMEQALKSAVLAGDEQAWRALYDQSVDSLYGFVHWHLGGDKHKTDDVVQECWLIAVRRIDSFQPERGRFLDWIRGIALNVIRNSRRREGFPNGRMRVLTESNSALSVTDPDPAAAEERSARIARAMEGLPPQYEAVLRAKYLEQQSVAQIAQERNESLKATESLLTRARAAFREAFLERKSSHESRHP